MLIQLKPSVTIEPWGDNFLLTNQDNRCTMFVLQENKALFDTLRQSTGIENLENIPHILHSLHQLCVRDCFTNNAEIEKFLFPKLQQQHPINRANWLEGSLYTWQSSLEPKSSLLSLYIVYGGFFLCGLLFPFIKDGITHYTLNPWVFEHNWLQGSVWCVLGLAIGRSWKIAAQSRIAALQHPTISAQIRLFCGIPYIGLDRKNMFHSSKETQMHYASLGLLTTLGVWGMGIVCQSIAPQLPWVNFSTGALLAFIWELGPLYDTDGAQLLELFTTHKQRLRTNDFIRQQLLRFKADVQGQTELRITSLVWTVWIGIALQTLGIFFVPYGPDILVQTLQSASIVEQLFLGAILTVAGVYYLYFLYQIIVLSSQLLKQILPSTTKIHKKTLPITDQIETQSVDAFTLFTDHPKQVEVWQVPPTHTIVEASTKPSTLLFLQQGDIQFVQPKPEGGYHVIFGLTAPTPISSHYLHHSASTYEIRSLTACTLWSYTDTAMVLQQRLEIVSKHPLFQNIPTDFLHLLAEHSIIQHYQPLQSIIIQGNPSNALFLLIEGNAVVENSTKSVVSAGDILGEMGILREIPRRFSILAKENCRCLEIPAHMLRMVMTRHPALSQALHAIQKERLATEERAS